MVRAYAGPPVLLAGAAALNVAPSQRRLNQRNGVEFRLIAAGISLAIIAVMNGLGIKLNTKFTSINTSLK